MTSRQASRPSESQFRSAVGTSVISSRNFGLFRGVSIQESFGVLQTHAKHRRSQSASKARSSRKGDSNSFQCRPLTGKSVRFADEVEDDDDDEEQEREKERLSLQRLQAKRGQQSTTAATPWNQANLQDKATVNWDWPLGTPIVINEDDHFEVKLKISPFRVDEVSAHLMGNELIVRCAKQDKRNEFYRSYTLPLNINPNTAEVTFIKGRHMRVSVQKEMPVRLALAFTEPIGPPVHIETEKHINRKRETTV